MTFVNLNLIVMPSAGCWGLQTEDLSRNDGADSFCNMFFLSKHRPCSRTLYKPCDSNVKMDKFYKFRGKIVPYKTCIGQQPENTK